MEISVCEITNWKHVLNAARFTQRKELTYKEPSEKFKKRMIRAEHSPLRCLLFYFDFYDIPYFVSVHLCRHVHAQPFVSTSRPDVLNAVSSESAKILPRSEQKKTDPVNMRLLLNAQEIINISKVRLCAKAETATRMIWKQAIVKLAKIEPMLAKACVPSCIYRGMCPEIKPCGYYQSPSYIAVHDTYINNLTESQDEETRV